MFQDIDLQYSEYLLDDAFQAQLGAMTQMPKITEVGSSEKGKSLQAFTFGHGRQNVYMAAGHHSDEPLGPHTLRALILQHEHWLSAELKERYSFTIIPHVNLDGEGINAQWIQNCSARESLLNKPMRELPGRDMEFAYPNRRRETTAVTEYLKGCGPMDLYLNLHGMLLSEGALLLMAHHDKRYKNIKERFGERAGDLHWKLHDHDRKGDKGFDYFGAGFTSTPRGQAMREHFLAKGDPAMADKFGQSSMEFVQSLGGDPMMLVSEIPLFRMSKFHHNVEGVPQDLLDYKAKMMDNEADLSEAMEHWGIESVSLENGMAWHLLIIEAALMECSTS
jgi:hypothetical protein